MVHWSNVEYILKNGMTYRDHDLRDPDYVNIGMRSLIADRHEYPVPIDGAGMLGEYVPFYFAGHSPMLYLIRDGKSGVKQRLQNDIVYFVCKFEKIKQENLPFLFTDRNTKIAVANYYQNEDDFDKLDWGSIKTQNWASDNTNLARRDLKQAEFLIHKEVPVSCIHGIVVKTSERKIYFDEMIINLGLSIPVYVDDRCKLYY